MLNKAKELFYIGDYKEALRLFDIGKAYYEAGLCSLLLGDEKKAKDYWKKEKCPDVATKWGLIVLDIIKLKVKEQPTFFQVRAFLEVYINLFIISNHLDWAENMISACNIFAKSNPETYKFIARVLFANEYYKLTHQFLAESKKMFFQDPEAHFIEAQAYYLEQEYKEAYKSIINALNSAPDYFPALEFKKEIEKKLNPQV